MPHFICPNCKQRSVDIDGTEGFDDQAVACRHCGFGFLFELTGWSETDLLGADVVDGLGLAGFDEGRNPAKLALEWGVRRLDEKLELRTRAGYSKRVTGDFFPAYDDDGGLLVALTPQPA